MSIKNFLKDLVPTFYKGILLFGIFGAAFYAYGAIDFPNSDPTPVSGVLGIYVGSSASAVNGAQTKYSTANNLCANIPTAGSNAHVCTIAEINNSYNHLSTMPSSGVVWVNSAPTFSGSNIANDCVGWSSSSSTDLATVWFFGSNNTGYSGITPCNQTYNFACCK